MSDQPNLPTAGKSDAAGYQCPWCGALSDAAALTCSGCGASVDVRLSRTDSGWSELPPMKDMAKIQFGQSYCQLEGSYVPVADMSLAGGDSVYFTHHLLLWQDPTVRVGAMSMRGGWKRVFAGLPLIMTQAHGPGHIAFSRDEPGEIIALTLQPRHMVDVREGVFMVGTGQVAYDWFNTNIWYTTQNGDDTETHYPVGAFMDRFSAADIPGLLLLHGAGNVFIRTLQPGESVLVKPTALLFKDTTVQMHLHIEQPSGTWRSWRSWGERYLWLRLSGPGRVGVQSAYKHLEDPGSTLRSVSATTTIYHW